MEQSRENIPEITSSQSNNLEERKAYINKKVIAILKGTTIAFRKPLASPAEFLSLKDYIGSLGFDAPSICLQDGTLIESPEQAIGQDTFTFTPEVYQALEKIIYRSYGLGSVLNSGHIEVKNRKMITQVQK